MAPRKSADDSTQLAARTQTRVITKRDDVASQENRPHFAVCKDGLLKG